MRRLALLLVAASCSAPARGAGSFVAGVYRSYDPTGAGDRPWDGAGCARTFSARLCALIEKDRREAGGEVGRLDGDPLYDAQDFAVTDLAFAVESEQPAAARVRVSFRNAGEARTVVVSLVREAGGWRIDDLTYASEQPPTTLTTVLTR
jgi:uncharacterized protein DUF3828